MVTDRPFMDYHLSGIEYTHLITLNLCPGVI
jgi:hypothetical protein